MLEQQLEDKEREWRETTEKLRTLELQTEQLDRQCTQIEAERTKLESELEDMTQKYLSTKEELDSTLQGLEDL